MLVDNGCICLPTLIFFGAEYIIRCEIRNNRNYALSLEPLQKKDDDEDGL